MRRKLVDQSVRRGRRNTIALEIEELLAPVGSVLEGTCPRKVCAKAFQCAILMKLPLPRVCISVHFSGHMF